MIDISYDTYISCWNTLMSGHSYSNLQDVLHILTFLLEGGLFGDGVLVSSANALV